jgi:hypothetical protein
MTPAEQKFEHELNVFRHDVHRGARSFCGYIGINELMQSNPAIFDLLDDAALFWMTVLAALQMDAFVTLGRIFDPKSRHSLNRLVRMAEDNREIFSRKALARRRGLGRHDEVADRAYEPSDADFRVLRKEASKWRKVYEANYRDLRHKLYAHRELADDEDIAALFSKTSVEEIEGLFGFLLSLWYVLWELFTNGRKADLNQQRRSIREIVEKPTRSSPEVMEILGREITHYLWEQAGLKRLAAR